MVTLNQITAIKETKLQQQFIMLLIIGEKKKRIVFKTADLKKIGPGLVYSFFLYQCAIVL